MKYPNKDDFGATAKGGGIEVHFKPTNTFIGYYRLADGGVSRSGVSHRNKSDDFGEYSFASDKVLEMATRAATEFAKANPYKG